MALCTADAVIRYASLSDPSWDAIEDIVERASAAVESYCRRSFDLEDRDETYDVARWQDQVALRHYPVTAVTAVYDGCYVGSEGRLVDAEEYVVDDGAGTIRLRRGHFRPGAASLRVVYTGGYETPPAAVVQAVVMLAADWYRSRPDGRAVSESYDGYSARYAAGLMPPQVAELLEPYRRRVVA